MVVTITENMTDVSMCESVTGWSDTIEQLTLINPILIKKCGYYFFNETENKILGVHEV